MKKDMFSVAYSICKESCYNSQRGFSSYERYRGIHSLDKPCGEGNIGPDSIDHKYITSEVFRDR